MLNKYNPLLTVSSAGVVCLDSTAAEDAGARAPVWLVGGGLAGEAGSRAALNLVGPWSTQGTRVAPFRALGTARAAGCTGATVRC